MADKMSVKGEVFELPLALTSKSGISKTLSTKDTYVDKDIKVEVTVSSVKFNDVDAGAITATPSTTDTTYTQQGTTNYPIVIAADAKVNAGEVSVKEAGFADTSDKVTIPAADATQATKTIYIKEGSLGAETAASVSATADGGITLGSESTTKPEGYSIKVASEGSVGVATAGWVDPTNNTAVDVSATKYYAIAKMGVKNAATTGVNYTKVSGPALISGDFLYIDAGYTEPIKIPLADLVPDNANVKAGTDGNSHLIYNTVTVYDNDGNLVTGTMGDATLSDITAENVAATIATVTVGEKTGSKYAITGAGAISGNTSVAIATKGYATTALTKNGSISGEANLESTINAGALKATADEANVTVTPTIAKETSTAQSGAIATVAPTTGKYVAVSAAAVEATATVTAAVQSEGYVKDETAETTVTAGSAASGTYYIPINSADHTVTKSASEISAPVTTVTTAVNTGDVTPITYSETSKVEGQKYIKLEASATTADGYVKTTAKCTSTEGYIEALDRDIVTTETVVVANASATAKYIKVYDGSIVS